MDQTRINQLIDQFVTESFDIHCAACSKMGQSGLALCRAKETASTTGDGFINPFCNHRVTFRAGFRHDEWRMQRLAAKQITAWPLFRHDGDNLRNHVASATNYHRIANPHILAANFIFIVQGRVGNGHSTNEDRYQPRHGRNRPGTTNLHIDTDNYGQRLFSWKFMGYGETRRTRDKTQLRLSSQSIDLVHNAINVVGQLRALFTNFGKVGKQSFGTLHYPAFFSDRKTPCRKLIHQFAMRFKRELIAPGTNAIGEE